jgi:hypothetical protein
VFSDYKKSDAKKILNQSSVLPLHPLQRGTNKRKISFCERDWKTSSSAGKLQFVPLRRGQGEEICPAFIHLLLTRGRRYPASNLPKDAGKISNEKRVYKKRIP